jgi:hypothetical protein
VIDDLSSAVQTSLSNFGLLVPSNWTRSSAFGPEAIDRWTAQILQVLPSFDKVRLRQDLLDYQRSMIDEGIVRYYTFAQSEEHATRLMVFTCSLSVIANPQDDVERESLEILKLGDSGWDVPSSMVTMHKGIGGEFMRAERLIEETSTLPWARSREVRYFFYHSESHVMAILSGTSPNVMDKSIVELFDRVAATFQWAPKGFS